MKKRKYEYTKEEEDKIIDAAEWVLVVIFFISVALGIVVAIALFWYYPAQFITGCIIQLLTTGIFLNYRAWVVIHHRKMVKSQDDNIE